MLPVLPNEIKIVVQKTRADGNCFLYALAATLSTYAHIFLTADKVKENLQNEVFTNLENYWPYVKSL